MKLSERAYQAMVAEYGEEPNDDMTNTEFVEEWAGANVVLDVIRFHEKEA